MIAGLSLLAPLAARAQQPAPPVIRFLISLWHNERPSLREVFRRGLAEAGYVEGRNVAIAYRFAESQFDPADISGRACQPETGCGSATGGGATILAARAAGSTIPIVFTFGGDPVQAGLIDNNQLQPEGSAHHSPCAPISDL